MEEGWEAFAEKKKNERLIEAEAFFQEHMGEFQKKFIANFDETCGEIVKKQEEGKLAAISYLEYTLLFHRFLKREYVAEVRVYGEDWYLDPDQMGVGTFDVSFLFETCTKLWEDLLSARKADAGKTTAGRVKEFMIEAIPSFYTYVTAALWFAILRAVEGENFRKIQREENFEINVGQYMGNTQAVYKENRKKDREELLDWIGMRLEYEYAFEDFSGMDFSGEDLSEIDFRYSDLRGCNLKGTDFQDAMLFGTRFCHADLEGGDFRYCMIYEADFKGANLQNAKFGWSAGDAGMPDPKNWKIVGFQGVNFQNADLRGADFSHAKMFGADFTGANLTGAVFDRTLVKTLCLSEEQRSGIRMR